MTTMSKVKVKRGDNLWRLLDHAGVPKNEIPGKLQRIADANNTTVAALDRITPEEQLSVPKDIADMFAAKRLVTFQGGATPASDASVQRNLPAGMAARTSTPEVIGNLADKTIRALFDDCVVTKQ